jgi:peptide/nickel transport system substrate-binding protein
MLWGAGLVLGASAWLLGAGRAAPPQPAQGKSAGPVLYVGVRSLPKFLSPATACTDPEWQAVELLFESLVTAGGDERLGERFFPGLADELPQVAPLKRQFRLDDDAKWSDGSSLVTPADVRHTAELLGKTDLPGRSSEWRRLLDKPRLDNAGPRQISFPLKQGYVEPLALLTFKVLPQTFAGQRLSRADDPKFAEAPVGSGPFAYRGRKTENGVTYAVFEANPHFRRQRLPGMPSIREIRFYVPADPAADFRNASRPLHLLTDVLPEQVAALKKQGIGNLRPLPSRRVYFLAVNHRVPALQRQELRRALAHAINRKQILKDHFRGDGPADLQVPLNGPFPAGSWACNTELPSDPSNSEEAKSWAGRAKSALRGEDVELSLKYPDDDPRVEAACADIKAQVEQLDGIRLRLEKVSPHQLRSALDRRAYDLAYHHHDYASAVYWLWPLFDTHPAALEAGGMNYLGYDNTALQTLFQKAAGHRQFTAVQKFMQAIHDLLYREMPLIPLWQLRPRALVHEDLTPVQLEAPRLFTHVAEWKLKKN